MSPDSRDGIFSKLTRTWTAVGALEPDDVMLATFPKTGSSWVRFTLLDYLLRRRGGDPRLTHDRVNRAMPEFPHASLGEPWEHSDVAPRLVKTHWRWRRFFPGGPHVLLVRDPRDVMVSMWRYINGVRTLPGAPDLGEVIENPRFGIRAYARHFESWNPRAGLVLRYEEILDDPGRRFGELLEFLGVPLDRATLEAAVEANSVAGMRDAQKRSTATSATFEEGFEFTRRDAVGRHRSTLTDEQRRRVESVARGSGLPLWNGD